MLSFDSSIQKSADLKTQPSTVNWKFKKSRPHTNICKIVQNFSNKWLKTTHLQFSQKSFKPCLRKLTIIAPFIPHQKIKQTKKRRKKRRKKVWNFFFPFSKLPQKRCQGGRRLHCQSLKVFLKRMKQKRPLKKR